MKKIWKFKLEILDIQVINMPKGAEVLCVQEQRGEPCMWVIVDSAETMEKRYFQIIGTGHLAKDTLSQKDYIGTIQDMGGDLIWHIFETQLENSQKEGVGGSPIAP